MNEDDSSPIMTTMQPSMATEQKNNKLVASTPIQNQENSPVLNKAGKENKFNDKEKTELDPKYLQPSTSKPLRKSASNDTGTKRKTVLSTTKQQSVYFNEANMH